jgi:hypothetical protein
MSCRVLLRNRRGLFTCVIVMALVLPARAEWIDMGDDGEARHAVDDASVLQVDDVVRVTKRAVFLAPQPMGELPGTPLVRETRGSVEIDCLRRQHRATDVEVISTENLRVWSSGPLRRDWERIEPGTPGMRTLDWVCARIAGTTTR